MQVPNNTLRFLVAELAPALAGATVKKIQSIAPDTLRFKLYTKTGSRDLIATPEALFFSEYRHATTSDAKGFVEFLKSRLEGKRIQSIHQHANDRLVVISFVEYDLVFELFAPENIALVDKDGIVAGCLHRAEHRDRSVWPKRPYAFPPAKPAVGETTLDEFREILAQSDKPLVQTLLFRLGLFPMLGEEAVFHAGFSNQVANACSLVQSEKLYAAIQSFDHHLFAPQTIEYKNDVWLLPFALPAFFKQHALVPVAYADFSTSLADDLARQLLAQGHQSATRTVSKRTIALQKSADALTQSLSKFEQQAIENQRKGEWVYSNYVEVKDLLSAIQKARQKKLLDAQVLSTLQAQQHTVGRFVSRVSIKTGVIELDVPLAETDVSPKSK
ncbi:MAG: NFACT family protein, partial [Candidatus Diapherotrites archaeon]|nr:NFACT family protein [Candidatus Diapherotrites archaeon]